MVVWGGMTLRASGGAPGAKPAERQAEGGAQGKADCIGQEIKGEGLAADIELKHLDDETEWPGRPAGPMQAPRIEQDRGRDQRCKGGDLVELVNLQEAQVLNGERRRLRQSRRWPLFRMNFVDGIFFQCAPN